jgi:hypothetical protein
MATIGTLYTVDIQPHAKRVSTAAYVMDQVLTFS